MKITILETICFIGISVIMGISTFEMVIPYSEFSMCTLKLNATHKFGCLAKQKSISGKVIFTRFKSEVDREISIKVESDLIFVIPVSIFLELSILQRIISTEKVLAIVVLSESGSLKLNNISYFTEKSQCREINYDFCLVQQNATINDLFENGYYYDLWRIPIILLRNSKNYQHNIINCFENYNFVKFANGPSCKMEISYFYPKKMSYRMCKKFQVFRRTVWNMFDFSACQPINGYNIYLTFSQLLGFNKKSFVVITSKMDTISMFDKSAVGSEELYPTLSLMIYLANVLKNNTNNQNWPSNSDVLMAFLDNESQGYMGTRRLIYDLQGRLISTSPISISTDQIVLVIILGEMDHLSDKIIINTNCDKANIPKVCDSYFNVTQSLFRENSINVHINQYMKNEELFDFYNKLDLPVIHLKSNVFSVNNFVSSFLDNKEPHVDERLNVLGDSLAKIIFNIISQDLTPRQITFKKFNPEPTEIAICLYNLSCPYFKFLFPESFLEPYYEFNYPLTAQSYVFGTMYYKQEPYFNRLSYFIMNLLTLQLANSLKKDSNCKDITFRKYFSLVNESGTFCYQVDMQVETDFNIDKNHEFYHASPLVYNYIRLYIEPDEEISTTILVMATIITALCFVSSIFIYRNIKSFINLD